MKVWLVTPAHGRAALTRVVLMQRVAMIADLKSDGIEAGCVVVAEDENLDTAEALGLDPVLYGNDNLGAKFNAGIRRAAEHGADIIVPAGSDCWVHPDYLVGLDPDGPVRTTHTATIVREDGRMLAHLSVTYRGGNGSRCWPRRLLKLVDFEPANPTKKRAIDTSILERVELAKRGTVEFTYRDVLFDLVDFKSGTNLNSYRSVRNAYNVAELDDPWRRLRRAYPPSLVDAMETVYAEENGAP